MKQCKSILGDFGVDLSLISLTSAFCRTTGPMHKNGERQNERKALVHFLFLGTPKSPKSSHLSCRNEGESTD